MKSMYFENGVKRYELTDVDSFYSGRVGYKEFKRNFDLANQMNALGIPIYLNIEVNNYCNMKCKMCIKSYDPSASGNDNIDLILLDKILKESRDLGIPSFFLGGGTECLINPQIKTIISHIREIGKGVDDVIITNGYCLTEDIIDQIIDYQWEKVFVSLDAATPETYSKIRGRELSVVENNIRNLIKKKRQRGSSFPIIRVSFCIQEDNNHEQEQFFEKWKNEVDIIDFQNLADYSDRDVRHDLPSTEKKCNQPFKNLFIDCKGNIMACCHSNWCNYHIIGNARNMTIEEAWNSNKMRNLRSSILSGNLCDVCKTCLNSTAENW